jgi:hypothetical protein
VAVVPCIVVRCGHNEHSAILGDDELVFSFAILLPELGGVYEELSAVL